MQRINKEVIRMELQISELIRMVANLNERLNELEEIQGYKMYLERKHVRERVR